TKMKPIKSPNFENEMSEDEEAASPPASDEDEELGEEEEEEEEEDEEEAEDKEMQADENSASEDSLDENKPSDRHPYPTPPPDEDAKMAPLDLLAKSKANIKSEIGKKKVPFITLAIMAIEKLKERSGSSVMAIMKYLKENGHSWEDEKRQVRNMNRALKLGVINGQLQMVKRSFKLTEASKKASMAVEKMKAKKAKQLAKEKEKEKLKKAKAQEKQKEKAMKKATKKAEKGETKAATKKEKPGKASERKTNQATKKKKAEEVTKDVPPKAKTAASVAARALLDTPTHDEMPAKKPAKTKAKINTSEAGKAKKPRKSIGTLAQTKASMPNVKAVKKLVAAKSVAMLDDIGELSEAQASSTPQAKAKRKRKV
ncbi:hypothetical protein KR200_001886, partial [Drosophila serrata]